MFIDQDIKEISQIPCDKLKDLIISCNEVDWEDETFGRNEVSLLEGRLCMVPCLISKSEQLVKTPDRLRLWASVSPVVEFVESLLPSYKMVRGEIVNLKPGRSLTPHIDIHWFHKNSRRIHVPIVTNDQSFLTFEERDYHLEVGRVYEINNRIMHSGFNKGRDLRVHVILDMMPIYVFNEAVASKQNFMEKV